MNDAEVFWRVPFSPQVTEGDFSLVIVNRPIPLHFNTFSSLWQNARVKICASGGANRLYDFVPESERKDFVPDCIKGSLETVLPHVHNFYSSLGSDIVRHANMDASAFTKCVHQLHTIELGYSPNTYTPNSPMPPNPSFSPEGPTSQHPKKVPTGEMYLVLGGLDGRFDQQMDIINSAYAHPERKFVIVGSDSFVLVLQPGLHKIEIDRKVMGVDCGLIPLGSPCRVHTSGLKWNLDKSRPLSFGGLISSSNTYESDEQITHITIQTDNPLIWTATLIK